MYILHNLARQSAFTAAWPSNPMVFEDKTSLLDFWARKIGPDFHELNVTGKDIIIALKYVRTSVGVNGSIGVDAIEHRPLKRYLVTDEHGRHLDIRE